MFIALSCCALAVVNGVVRASPQACADLREDEDVWGLRGIGGPEGERRANERPAIVPESWLVLSGDAVDGERWFACFLADPDAVPPVAGGLECARDDGEARWRVENTCALDGIAIAFTTVTSDRGEVRMARLDGAELLLVNGEPFLGDVERRGYRGVPVALREGPNALVVAGIRGGFELELWDPCTRIVLADWAFDPPPMTREIDTWFMGFIDVATFNASVEPVEYLHLHYGPAVPEHDGPRPRVLEWMDGDEIAPLALLSAWIPVLPAEGVGGLDAVTASVALVPVCAWERGDPAASRAILRLPLAEPGVDDEPTERSLDRVPQHLVYGTLGTSAESAALLSRARLDQQRAWYAHGRTPPIVTDRQYLARVEERGGSERGSAGRRDTGLHAVLYGNADTNAASKGLLGQEPKVSAWRGRVVTEASRFEGDASFGYAMLERPPDARGASRVLWLFDTGLAGARLGALIDPLRSNSETAVGVTDRAFVESSGLPDDPRSWHVDRPPK